MGGRGPRAVGAINKWVRYYVSVLIYNDITSYTYDLNTPDILYKDLYASGLIMAVEDYFKTQSDVRAECEFLAWYFLSCEIGYGYFLMRVWRCPKPPNILNRFY